MGRVPGHDEVRFVYCYNSAVASMRIFVWARTACGRLGRTLRDTLVADGHARFEPPSRTSS